MFDRLHWRDIAEQLWEQTRAQRVQWVEDEVGPERTTGFACRFDADGMSFSLWGYPTGYSYNLSVQRTNLDDSTFTDSLRVKNKESADGVPIAELFRCVRDQVADTQQRAAQENSASTFRQLVDGLNGMEPDDDYVSVRGFSREDFNGHYDFDAAQWNVLLDLLLERTRDNTLAWKSMGAQTLLSGEYVTELPGELSIGFFADDEGRGPGGRIFDVSVVETSDMDNCLRLNQVPAIAGIGHTELDQHNAEPRCHAALLALHDHLRRDLINEDATFRDIAREETFRSILASIAEGTEESKPDTGTGPEQCPER